MSEGRDNDEPIDAPSAEAAAEADPSSDDADDSRPEDAAEVDSTDEPEDPGETDPFEASDDSGDSDDGDDAEDGGDGDQGAESEETEESEETDGGDAAAAALPDEELDRIVEALLFASPDALTPAKLGEAAGGVSPRLVRRSLQRLRASYARELRAFDVIEIAGGFKLYSRPEYQEYVARLERMRAPEKLSPSALETLAIVAYRQPIIRADLDSVRGVQSGAILKSLMDRKLIRVVGRADQPGRPLLYGTTKRFLDHFGLASLKDLPRVEDLKAP